MISSIVIVGALIPALLYSMGNLKAIQMDIQCSLIWEVMFFDFKLGYNDVVATKNICCTKGEDVIDKEILLIL